MKRFIAGGAAVLLASAALALGFAAPASAHTPVLTADCDSISIDLTSYPSEGNTISGSIDGVNLGTTSFGSEFHSGEYALDPAVAHTWTVVIDSSDGDQYDTTITGSSDSDCLPVVVPEQPADVVTFTEWVDGVWECDDTEVVQTRTKSVVTHNLVDNVWIASDPVVTVESQTRALAEDEIVACPPALVKPTVVIETSCGVATVTFTNGTPYAFAGDVRVDNETPSHTDYYGLGDFYQIVNIPAYGSIMKTYEFEEDSGDHTVAARIGLGAESDWYVPWQDATVESDCEINIPEHPAPVVVVEVEETTDCDAATVTETTTTTTTGWIYDETTNTWIAGEPVVETADVTRDATEEECPAVIVPPTEEPTPPTEEPAVVTPVAAATPVAPAPVDLLASTGVEAAVGIMGAAILASLGIIGLAFARRKSA